MIVGEDFSENEAEVEDATSKVRVTLDFGYGRPRVIDLGRDFIGDIKLQAEFGSNETKVDITVKPK